MNNQLGAGQLFICGCCAGSFDETLARFDDDLQAPVCAGCDRNLKWAKAHLKDQGITPVLKPWHFRNRSKDIDNDNLTKE